jgi:hypothetical protein
MRDAELAGIAEGLQASPYSLPDDAANTSILREMLPLAADLEERCMAVREGLAQAFSDRLGRVTRTNEIFESNAIEGKTATLLETRDILDQQSMWDAEAALARYTLHTAIADEPKVQDVVGLAAARILVDQYIAERDRPLNEADLRNMHSLILRGDRSAGRYKQYLNSIGGSAHTPIRRSRCQKQCTASRRGCGTRPHPCFGKARSATRGLRTSTRLTTEMDASLACWPTTSSASGVIRL